VRVLPTLALTADGFEIETEMNVHALQAKLRVAEVASFEADRIHGESNLNTFRDGWRVVKVIGRQAWQDCCREWTGLWKQSVGALGGTTTLSAPMLAAPMLDLEQEHAAGD
jgi:hypothetical protein